jgi:hypothetical protein
MRGIVCRMSCWLEHSHGVADMAMLFTSGLSRAIVQGSAQQMLWAGKTVQWPVVSVTADPNDKLLRESTGRVLRVPTLRL